MKFYLLINVQDTDDAFGANVTPFIDREAAQSALRQTWEETVKDWEFDASEPKTDEHYCSCDGDSAVICDAGNVETWKIEEHEISVKAAVEVVGCMVSNVYANADLDVDVYDLDVSDFPDEGEQEAADTKKEELEALIKSSGWRPVW